MRSKEKIEAEIMDLLGHYPDLIPAFNNEKDCFGQKYDGDDRQCAHVCDPDDAEHSRREVCRQLSDLCREIREVTADSGKKEVGCVVEGCQDKVYTRGFCDKHYKQSVQGIFKKVVKKGGKFIEDDRSPIPVGTDVDVELRDEDAEYFYFKITAKLRLPKKHLARILGSITE
jgi:hypothetical protein